MHPLPAVMLGALLASAIPAAAQLPDRQTTTDARDTITGREIGAHIQFLSSDLLEGRAPGHRGGRIAEEYIASELKASGVLPGMNGSYFQPVPIDVVNADPNTIHVVASGRANMTLHQPNDVMVWAGSATPRSDAHGELVFVGYGTRAPEYRWDDFKGMDLKGKILLVLVNDPPAPSSEPALFGGKAMTYYGRWMYKFEEAERQGAAGMLVIHNTADAGYAWSSMIGTFSAEHRMLPYGPDDPRPIGVRGWIQYASAATLLKQVGLNLDTLRKAADSRSFRPVPTGITMDMSFTNSVRYEQSDNVVGIVPGADPQLRHQYVSYGAHWDHVGISTPVNGDSIYNGALDNASGVAVMLAVARHAAVTVKPKRSQLFLFYTCEECGLLGSIFYGVYPTVPTRDIVANLNVDILLPMGQLRDLMVLGETRSSLGPSLAAYVRPLGMRLTPDPHPEAGNFYRSDHFALAKVGIPAMSIGTGVDVVGRPAGWGLAHEEDYGTRRYHWPSDEYQSGWDMTSLTQVANIIAGFGTTLADARTIPTWNADAEFRAARDSTLQNR